MFENQLEGHTSPDPVYGCSSTPLARIASMLSPRIDYAPPVLIQSAIRRLSNYAIKDMTGRSIRFSHVGEGFLFIQNPDYLYLDNGACVTLSQL